MLQKKIPLPLRGKVAGLARRVDMPLAGIRLLNPLVRPTDGGKSSASPAEIAEYSGCLTFIGAGAEASELLKELSPEECPESLLFRSFAHFSQWEYGATIPLLKRYVRSPKLTDYARAIGNINLLAALVYEKHFTEALNLRNRLAAECRSKGYVRLLGNCFELAAAIFVEQRRIKEARSTIAEAKALATENRAIDIFYAQKWEVVLNFMLSPKRENTLSALHAIRAEAQNRGLWETVRQSDAYEAVYLRNAGLCAQVYFGTPFPKFREQLLKDYGSFSVPEEYLYRLQPGESSGVLDLLTGTFQTSKSANSPRMKPGQVCHRLLNILFSDLYRPLRVAVAHHELFPEQHFNPSSSAHRVHESVRRLRSELNQRKIPLVITETDGFYRVSAKKPIEVRFSKVDGLPDSDLVGFSLLAERWPNDEFTVQESLKFLRVSKRTAIRTLNRLELAGKVVRIGQSSSTRYRLQSTSAIPLKKKLN